MKKLWLQVTVVVILATTFVAFPLLVYPPIPESVSLTPVPNHDHGGNSSLNWFKNPHKEQFYGIPTKGYPEHSQNEYPYLIQTPAKVDFYDANNSYLIMPQSKFGQFLVAHQTALNAQWVYVVRSSSAAKYQVVNTPTLAIKVKKQPNSRKIILLNLPEADYQALLEQKTHDPKLSNMIAEEDSSHHNISIDPTIHKADLKIWAKNAWRYLTCSVHLENISKTTYADTNHNG